MTRVRGRRGAFGRLCGVFAVAACAAAVPVEADPAGAVPSLASTAACPWASAAAAKQYTPDELAEQVLGRMTLAEKIGEVELINTALYENENAGVPRLCIPPLTLEDGPNGLAAGDTGVTQLPASIGVAASFNPSVASAYGAVIGAQAREQGIDVVQGPNLNLARLPNTGRIFEGYGEDPDLAGAMGVADIDGIQSEGVMADAKHFGVYTQETARLALDQIVTERALAEVYLAPFYDAVTKGHVASLMCAYGEINNVNTCQDQALYALLKSWGFAGFVRSDMGAVADPVAAFDAGLDVLKPSAPSVLEAAVQDGELPITKLNDAVLSLLTAMFANRLIADPLSGETQQPVETAHDIAVARSTAEDSMVLLKNDGLLPLIKAGLSSVAVIGTDAGSAAVTAGSGSAYVDAPFVSTPLSAIKHWLGHGAKVTYSPGGPAGPSVTPMPGSSVADLKVLNEPGVVTTAVETATQPGSGKGWELWDKTLDPTRSGLYDLSVTTVGDTWVYLNGSVVLAEPGLHGPAPWTVAEPLVAGRRYSLEVRWFAARSATAEATAVPQLSWSDVSPTITAAVRAARHANVALVFVNDFNDEGFDRPTLDLPGDENALISAVAAVNPRTVVVLNTGGAVVMPWLSKVAAVLEAWYPGEEDGAATVAVLSGAVDPSGHLPLTFPRSAAQSPMADPASWPGVDGSVYAPGLDIGYRYYDEAGLDPLFPFGFGLSYTTFSLANARITSSGSADALTVDVTNTGSRSGTAVMQAYLGFPAGSGEPPYELKAFATVSLSPGETQAVRLTLACAAFEVDLGGRWQTLSGTYTVAVGQSQRDLPIKLALPAP